VFRRTDGWMIYMDDVLRFNGVHSHKLVYKTHTHTHTRTSYLIYNPYPFTPSKNTVACNMHLSVAL